MDGDSCGSLVFIHSTSRFLSTLRLYLRLSSKLQRESEILNSLTTNVARFARLLRQWVAQQLLMLDILSCGNQSVWIDCYENMHHLKFDLCIWAGFPCEFHVLSPLYAQIHIDLQSDSLDCYLNYSSKRSSFLLE
jgi:hypothetical protein